MLYPSLSLSLSPSLSLSLLLIARAVVAAPACGAATPDVIPRRDDPVDAEQWIIPNMKLHFMTEETGDPEVQAWPQDRKFDSTLEFDVRLHICILFGYCCGCSPTSRRQRNLSSLALQVFKFQSIASLTPQPTNLLTS